MVKIAEAVETELRCTVVQAVQQGNGTFGKLGNVLILVHIFIYILSELAEATFRKDVQRLDNVPFNEAAILDVKPRRNTKKCKAPE